MTPNPPWTIFRILICLILPGCNAAVEYSISTERIVLGRGIPFFRVVFGRKQRCKHSGCSQVRVNPNSNGECYHCVETINTQRWHNMLHCTCYQQEPLRVLPAHYSSRLHNCFQGLNIAAETISWSANSFRLREVFSYYAVNMCQFPLWKTLPDWDIICFCKCSAHIIWYLRLQ